MAGTVQRGNFSKFLLEGINAAWGMAYNDHKEEYSMVFKVYTSRKAFEEDVQVTGTGLAPIKDPSTSIQFDSVQQGPTYRYTHLTYAIGFILEREYLEDNIYPEVIQQQVSSLARSVRQTRETVCANIFNRAFTAGYTYFDGATLCSTSRSRQSKGGTWSNQLSTNADLSEASLEQMCIDVGKFDDDQGLKIAVRPAGLLVPVDLTFEACRILKSVQQNDTANNAINALRTMGKIPKVMENHYLTDTDAYFLITDCPNGFKLFQRRPDEIDEDGDFVTEARRYKATSRFSAGCTDPHAVYGSAGS